MTNIDNVFFKEESKILGKIEGTTLVLYQEYITLLDVMNITSGLTNTNVKTVTIERVAC